MESIYNIVPPKVEYAPKGPLYRSKHDGALPPTATTFVARGGTHPIANNIAGSASGKIVGEKAGRTMGAKPGTSRNDPNNYMKKMAKSSSVPNLSTMKRTNPEVLQPTNLKTKLKPVLPKTDDAPIMNLVTAKNFVVANAVQAILAAPQKVQTGTQDYLHKEDYGKVPKYLQHIKQDIENEYLYIEQMQEAQRQQDLEVRRPLDENERMAMIEGLKHKWEDVNRDYQGQTHLTVLDRGKVYRKEKWEAELQSIEKDIEKLNKNNIIIDGTC